MKVHFLNCGTMQPKLAQWIIAKPGVFPSLCILIEDSNSLLLVDSGFGTLDMVDTKRLGVANLFLNARPDFQGTAVRQIEKMGFKAEDVRHIICTHLDRDHAGGLSDFPQALVHVSRAECEAALKPKMHAEADRYRRCHFDHEPRWVTYDSVSQNDWFGLPCFGELEGLPSFVRLVSLPGHTRGHCGVAVETGDGWVFHCGDAYYVKKELMGNEPLKLGLRAFRRMAHIDFRRAMQQVEVIRSLLAREGSRITTVASHDPTEFATLY